MALPKELCGYTVISKLGEGAFSIVYKVKKDNKEYALKKLFLNNTEDEGVPVDLVRELDVVKTLSSKYCTKPVDILSSICSASSTDKSICLVYELAKSDLFNQIYKNRINTDTIKKWIFQLICGVDHLHTNNIVHLDLKPPNILCNYLDDISLSDFGLARRISNRMDNNVITTNYKPPELLFKEEEENIEYTEKVDIWSIGCIIYEMIVKWPLFEGSEEDIKDKLIVLLGSPPENLYKTNRSKNEYSKIDLIFKYKSEFIPHYKIADVIKGCLHYDPTQRLSTTQLLSLPYFDDFKCEQQCVVYPQLPININDQKKQIFSYTLTKVDTTIYKLLEAPYFLAVDIYDRYETLKPDHKYQPIDIIYTCIYLALNVYPTGLYKFLSEAFKNGYDPNKTIDVECDILETLKYILYRPTPLTYLRQLLKGQTITEVEFKQYLTDVTVYLMNTTKYDSAKDLINTVLKGKLKI